MSLTGHGGRAELLGARPGFDSPKTTSVDKHLGLETLKMRDQKHCLEYLRVTTVKLVLWGVHQLWRLN